MRDFYRLLLKGSSTEGRREARGSRNWEPEDQQAFLHWLGPEIKENQTGPAGAEKSTNKLANKNAPG